MHLVYSNGHSQVKITIMWWSFAAHQPSDRMKKEKGRKRKEERERKKEREKEKERERKRKKEKERIPTTLTPH